MKFKKNPFPKYLEKDKPNTDKVVISSEYYTNEIRPSYLCSFCNQTLIRLTDTGQNNTSFWCRSCSVEFDPESENLRLYSILTNMADEVAIRYTVPKRGGFAELEKKGIRIK